MEAVGEATRGSKRKAEDTIPLAPKRIKVEDDTQTLRTKTQLMVLCLGS